MMVAAEAAPLAKSGGLGDMVSAFSSALRSNGVDVSILMPGYDSAFERVVAPTPLGYLRGLPGGDARLWRAAMPDADLTVLLLQMDHLFAGRSGRLYQDEQGREYLDNFARFASLSVAAARIAAGVRGVKRPRIVHAHDWHAGLTPLMLKLAGAPARSVFTIHNLAFQGNYPLGLAPYAGIQPELLVPALNDPRSIEFYDTLSFMKAAIVHADRLTTVSERYAREIFTPQFGHRMEGVLAANAHKLTGIVNGIDDTLWNPLNDEMLAQPYNIDDLSGKHACKKALQQTYGLRVDPFAPLVAVGSRLSTQKLAEVVCEALPAALARWPRVQFAVLGQGDAAIENALRRLAAAWPERLGVHIGYDEERAHRLHAGADILLHGSRFEPCGLTQLYAMRYGTVPVASRVGGLVDTIVDCPALSPNAERAQNTPLGNATGFLFDGESPADIFHALGRALDAYGRPQLWRALQRNAMGRDSGWSVPAQHYLNLYHSLAGQIHRPDAAPVCRAAPKIGRVRGTQPRIRRSA
ncbi:glycogen synthase GlgA [Paraburkholderia sp. J76]|uniref:glycogen synthase GlgA n=1 Tax=Paraburkholderia sp. J76 TaxID=2805439 RepID=UPI002ABE244E|nr:glycogen synthase GlgA [Paraburkholderia sp. J76]